MNFELRATNEIRQNADGTRTTVIINTDRLDSYRTVIVPEGGNLEEYKRNPVVLFNHDTYNVLGKSSIRLQDGRLIAEMGDDDWDDDDPEAMRIKKKVKKGIIRGASIGFNYADEDVSEEEDERGTYYRINKWNLMEWSYVTIPSNKDALVTQRQEKLAELADIHQRLDEIESKIGNLADREYIMTLLSNREPINPADPEPIKEQKADKIRSMSGDELAQLIQQTINRKLGKQ